MKQGCRKTINALDHWLDLSEEEKAVLHEHADDCATCRSALQETEQIMSALNDHLDGYQRMAYMGRMPEVAQRRNVLLRFPALTLRWAAAVVLFLGCVWFTTRSPDGSRSRSSAPARGGSFRMPSLPARPSMTSVSLTPSTAHEHLSSMQREIDDEMRRYLRMPKQPVLRNPAQSKDGTGQSTYRDDSMQAQAQMPRTIRRKKHEA